MALAETMVGKLLGALASKLNIHWDAERQRKEAASVVIATAEDLIGDLGNDRELLKKLAEYQPLLRQHCGEYEAGVLRTFRKAAFNALEKAELDSEYKGAAHRMPISEAHWAFSFPADNPHGEQLIKPLREALAPHLGETKELAKS